MIESFRDRETEEIAAGGRSDKFPPELQRRLRMLIERIHAATSLDDLRVLRSHRLRRLDGDDRDRFCIDLDPQWRICFTWREGNAHDVALAD